ncbi:MAG: MGH1-like glycoside hydrolase domain-containing protein [Luteolibacter sp.]
MKFNITHAAALLTLTPLFAAEPPFTTALKSAHTFQTADQALQRLHDAAEQKLLGNLVRFTPSMQVLVEGGGYPNAWIETQPMGGEMYARRDVQTGLNNNVIFMITQRDDGRLPGMVIAGDTTRRNGWIENPPEAHLWFPEADMLADFEMFQGFCFPEPAWRMYHWIGKDKRFLELLRDSLTGHDAYLWRTRDSTGNGVLETWCVWDTGEDESTRLTTRWAPNRWPFDKPPGAEGMPDPRDPAALRQYWQRRGPGPESLDEIRVPFQSMDIMAYSYNARATLAKIETELGNPAKAAEWRKLADQVRQTVIDKLWVPERNAAFDLDRDGNRLPELIHNNLRCMWYGMFTQEMADAFVDNHLLDPETFWTPVPLVSIAINEPLFYNGLRNNWSGQPQGLTYQRAIGALERYGRFAEVTRLGQKLLPTLIRNDNKFTQQLDPITGAPSGQTDDGYGPMMLAALEYLTRMHGIHLAVDQSEVWWSSVDATDFITTQTWGDHHFRLESKNGALTATVGGKTAFTITPGTRVITDLEGTPLQLIGIHPEPQTVTLTVGDETKEITVQPNQFIKLE